MGYTTVTRIPALMLSLILLSASVLCAQDDETEFLYGFLQGTYQVIGRAPDSNETYSGTMALGKKKDHLRVLRRVNGETSEGIGRIDVATADKIKILKVEFTQNSRSCRATYLIHSDLDNYARLTGYVFLKGGGTKEPGLEALFIDRRASDNQ